MSKIHQIVKDMIGKNDEYLATCPKCKVKIPSSKYWDKDLGKCAKCGYKNAN